MEVRSVVIIDGMRTPFGKIGSALRDFYMTDLGAIAVNALLKKTDILRQCPVDCLFSGSALHDARTVSPARYISLLTQLPYETSTSYIEMQCGSAIACINHAGWKIAVGEADVIIAGGAESYSQAFAKFSMSVEPYRLIPPMPVLNRMAPLDEDNISMLDISDAMAKQWEISREACDAFAARSQQRAAQATTGHYFDEEIVPIEIKGNKKNPPYFHSVDEQLRPDTTVEALARLRPMNEGGVTTAGNASGLNDGAAYVLMMSEEKAQSLGIQPYARWLGGGEVGVKPSLMGIAPAYSNLKVLKQFGLRIADISVFECNEAFAAQNLAVIKEMEYQSGECINPDNWNPIGGAIAFGHPNGASGARISIAAMKELRRRGGTYALISACCGGGLGVSALIQNIE